MNHTVSLLVLLIASSCLLSLVQSKAAATAGPQFIEFDDKSWQDALKTKDYTLILFNNPTNKACHECYIARFELEELAEDHKDENSLIIGQVDCHALPDICTQYEVFSDFPKVKLAFKDTVYDFPTTKIRKDHVWEFIQSYMADKFTSIKSPSDLEIFVESNKISMIAIFDHQSHKSIASFKRTSYRLFKQLPFALLEIFDQSEKEDYSEVFLNQKRLNLLPENIAMVKRLGEHTKTLLFNQQISRKRLTAWINQNHPWLTKEVDGRGFSQVLKGNLPVVTLYIQERISIRKDALVDVLDSLVEEFKNKAVFSFRICDDEDLSQLRIYGYDLSIDVPPVVYYDVMNSQVYTLENEQELSASLIREWINNIQAKKIKPHMIKQKPPVEGDSVLVKTIVTDTYRKFILQDSDVVVFYYAPAKVCKQCLVFYEEFEKIAHILSKKGYVFGKIDMEANPRTPGDRIPGYPTIKFFPREDKKGIIYPGKREAEPLGRWLRENGSLSGQQRTVLLEDGKNELLL